MTFKFLQRKVNTFFNSTMLLCKIFYDRISAVCKSKKYPSKKIFFITLWLILWNNIFFIHAHGDKVKLINSSEFFLTLIPHNDRTKIPGMNVDSCEDCEDMDASITLKPGKGKDIKLLKHTKNYDVYVTDKPPLYKDDATDKPPLYKYDFTIRSVLIFNFCKPEEKIISNFHDLKAGSFFRLTCKDQQLIITNEFVSAYLWRAIRKGPNGFYCPPSTAQEKPAKNALFLKKKVIKEDNKAFFNKISRTPKAYNLQDAVIEINSYDGSQIPLHEKLDVFFMLDKSDDLPEDMQAIKNQIFTKENDTEEKDNTDICSWDQDSLSWISDTDTDDNALKAATRPVEDIKLFVEKALDDDKVAAIIQAINTLSCCNSHKDKSIALVELFTKHLKCCLYQIKTNLNDCVFGFSQHAKEALRKLKKVIDHEKTGKMKAAKNSGKQSPCTEHAERYIKKIKLELKSLGKDRTKPLPKSDVNFETAEEQQAYDTLKKATADYKEYYFTECKKHESVLKIEYSSTMSEEMKQEIIRLRDQYLLELTRFFVIREIFLCAAFIEYDIKQAFDFNDEEIGLTHIDDDIDELNCFYCLKPKDSTSCLVIPRLADKIDDLINYAGKDTCDRYRWLPVG